MLDLTSPGFTSQLNFQRAKLALAVGKDGWLVKASFSLIFFSSSNSTSTVTSPSKQEERHFNYKRRRLPTTPTQTKPRSWIKQKLNIHKSTLHTKKKTFSCSSLLFSAGVLVSPFSSLSLLSPLSFLPPLLSPPPSSLLSFSHLPSLLLFSNRILSLLSFLLNLRQSISKYFRQFVHLLFLNDKRWPYLQHVLQNASTTYQYPSLTQLINQPTCNYLIHHLEPNQEPNPSDLPMEDETIRKERRERR
jgi:hypothetical protein